MSNDAPKLYVHKPKKALLKKHLQHQKQQQQSGTAPATAAPPPPPVVTPKTTTISSTATAMPPVKESFARRYRFMWPLLLAVNFSVGAYLFMRTKNKEKVVEEVTAITSTPTTAISTASVPAVVEQVKVHEPIPLDQQRELLKWILEEKRKLKPNDPEEKKRIDEEKAILKQFIRAKSLPSL